jgi:putative addiction module component (TIGR02574 family)
MADSLKPSAQQILSAAMTLPPEEREEIAEQLLGSLEGDGETSLSPAWQTEIRRRLKEIDEGTAELVDGEEFLRWLSSKRQAPVEKRP